MASDGQRRATAIGIPAAVLAHQGGWDEILLVAGPIALVARPPGAGPPAGHRATQPAPAEPSSRPDGGPVS